MSYYELLGVSKESDVNTITKAYRKLAIQHHPDKGGDPAKFSELSNAYEVLKDPEKRKLYDLGGMDAVERGHAGGSGGGFSGDPMDIFGMMSGRGGSRRQPQGPTKGQPVTFPLELTLEEMYTGTSKKLRLTRSVVCKPCDGKGGSKVVDCATCQGRGVRVVVQRLGPGMITQSQQTCDNCQGKGRSIPPGAICTSCQGAQVIKEKKNLEVLVPAGARTRQQVNYPGEGDHYPGSLAGDMIVEFAEKRNDSLFSRKGHHLHLRQKISLLEALVGFTFYITQLDGRQIKYTSTTVIKPGDVACIEGEGFPHSFGDGRGIDTGNLYVHFEIQFPTSEQLQNAQQLTKILPKQSTLRTQPQGSGPNAKDIKITVPHASIVDMSTEDRKHSSEESKWNQWLSRQERNAAQDDDDDDDHGHHGGGPACQPL